MRVQPWIAALLMTTFSFAEKAWCAAPAQAGPAEAESAPGQAVSLAEYSARLRALDAVVAKCQNAMVAANCKREDVGSDLQVTIPGGSREVRLEWLRALMDQAAKGEEVKTKKADAKAAKPAVAGKAQDKPQNATAPEAKAGKDSKPKDSDDEDSDEGLAGVPPGASSNPEPKFVPLTLAERLTYARERLAADESVARQMEAAAPGEQAKSSSGRKAGDLSRERSALDQILAAKEYHPATVGPSVRDRILERIARWVNKALSKVADAGFKSEWAGRAAEIGFVIALCVALVWFLIRLERKGRLGVAQIRPGIGTGAVSARDWQLWLQDARQAAAKGEWRDAIHLLYWASISRLESAGMWPADRARTPREYLALVARESSERSDLTALTRSFERTWYAGRVAAEADFRQAEQIAGRLGAR